MRTFCLCIAALLAVAVAAVFSANPLNAQQTLGGITGEVTDASGGVIPNVTVTVTDEQTSLTRTTKTNGSGSYSFVNLPIGVYTLTYSADGYQAQKTPHITVQADRTATLNASLKVGQASTTVEVEAAPLMNAVDTTNGYVMETQQIDAVPLPTGSFTGLAILSPGVDAELPGGTGANSGLGNAPIWANGQRDTSNAFLVNGVDASNLFNGKSTSQVDSFRVVNNTGAGQQRGRRRDSQRRLGLSRHRQRHPHARARNHRRGTRQRIDVRRAAGLRQRRAHRHEHQVGDQPIPRQRSTPIAAPTGSMPRRSFSKRTTTFLPPTRTPSCTATFWAAISAGRSSRTSSLGSSAISTCISPTRRPATNFSSCRRDWLQAAAA